MKEGRQPHTMVGDEDHHHCVTISGESGAEKTCHSAPPARSRAASIGAKRLF